MPWKDPENNKLFIWIYVLIIGAWSGLVRYFIDCRINRAVAGASAAISQVMISAFVGIISGLISVECGAGIHLMLAMAGMSGAMGATALTYYWKRLTGGNDGGI